MNILAKLAYDAMRLQTKLYEQAQQSEDTSVKQYLLAAADNMSLVLTNIHEILNSLRVEDAKGVKGSGSGGPQ